jgi:hypothetical protein
VTAGKAGVKTADAGAVTGVTGIKCTQSGGKTILTFTRPFNNGVANYAQISTTSTTATMFAAGNVPTFAAQVRLVLRPQIATLFCVSPPPYT